jgi:hypothetical protein
MEHPLKQFQHAFIYSAYLFHPRDGGVRSWHRSCNSALITTTQRELALWRSGCQTASQMGIC